MKKEAVFIVALLLIPVVYSLTIKDLLARYSFSTSSTQINVLNQEDFMIDKNNNGVNDTLVIELTANNSNGNFIFLVNLFDTDYVLINETNKTLSSGINKLNLTFSSVLFSNKQFNYSIKIYNASYSLKYRKDNILTQEYSSYEQGLNLLNIIDKKVGKILLINATLNSSINGIFEAALFLLDNNTISVAKSNQSLHDGVQAIIFAFDNETIKKTHYIGPYNIQTVKIGRKLIKTNFSTNSYDFRDFAATPYIDGFADGGVDNDNDGKFGVLQINVSIFSINNNDYSLKLSLYDLFDNLVQILNVSISLAPGLNIVQTNFNGSKIYDKKLNGPFIVKYIELYDNGTLVDKVNNAYITKNYNFNDFDMQSLPDLIANITLSDEFHYGINNITVNLTFKNIGNKHAYNLFAEFSDNNSFNKSEIIHILKPNSEISSHINFVNFSDFEVSAFADLNDFIEELNESNNVQLLIVRLNKPPFLKPVENITVNELETVVINLSATDSNEDELIYFINNSRFSQDQNSFSWSTTADDEGNYTIKALVSDGFLNDSSEFTATILHIEENDLDSDKIDDGIDSLIGNATSVYTSTINLSIIVNSSDNLSKLFNGNLSVKILDSNLTVTEFHFDFTMYKLNITNLTIDKQNTSSKGEFIVKGLELAPNTTKSVYVDRLNNKLKSVCIRDVSVANIEEISGKCNAKNEFKVSCNGKLKRFAKYDRSYRCAFNSTSRKYKVEGLKNSAVIQVK